jgi:hypothetical protein
VLACFMNLSWFSNQSSATPSNGFCPPRDLAIFFAFASYCL